MRFTVSFSGLLFFMLHFLSKMSWCSPFPCYAFYSLLLQRYQTKSPVLKVYSWGELRHPVWRRMSYKTPICPHPALANPGWFQWGGIHGGPGARGPDVPAVSCKRRAFFTEQSEGCAGAGGRREHRIRVRSMSLYAKPGPPELEWASEFPGGLVRTQIVQPCHQHFWFGRSTVNTNFSFSSRLPGHSDAADSGTTVKSPMLNHTVPKATRLIKEHHHESPLKELQKDCPCPLRNSPMCRSYSCPW